MRPIHNAFLAILSLACSNLSCKHNEAENTHSSTKHNIGDVVSLREEPLKDCHQVDKIFSKIANQYLQTMMLDLMTTVNQSGKAVFVGNLSPKNFCIGTELADDYMNDPNAIANAENGLIIFNTSLILRAPNDSYLAAILAHEIAHILLNHEGDFPLHTFGTDPGIRQQLITKRQKELETAKQQSEAAENYISYINFDKIYENEAFLAALSSGKPLTIEDTYKAAVATGACVDADCSQFHLLFAAYRKAEAALTLAEENLRNYVKLHFNSADVAHKYEIDADEVGLEIFVRGGWKASDYIGFALEFGEAFEGIDPKSCFEKDHKQVMRGAQSHPDSCWRAHNILSELRVHRNDLLSKYSGNKTRIASGPSLAEVKADIRKVMESLPATTAYPSDEQAVSEEDL